MQRRALVGIALMVAACGSGPTLAKPQEPPVWPVANITAVSPRSHGTKAPTAQAAPEDAGAEAPEAVPSAPEAPGSGDAEETEESPSKTTSPPQDAAAPE